MPLVLDPTTLPEPVLDELRRSLLVDLEEIRELVLHPAGPVLDPVSLETAGQLVRSTLAVLERPGARSPEEKAADINLAYATMLAVIDLVKSHTDVPRVPRPRSSA